MNPWNLTPAEVQAMDAMCDHGSYKGAARAIGKSARTLENQVGAAAKRMGMQTALQRYLAWDRGRRENASLSRP